MSSDLKLLAHVPNLIEPAREYCAQREARFPYFRDGFVDMDLGRHTNWTDAIREATVGYGIADARGKVLATGKSLTATIAAREKASTPVIPQIDLAIEDDAAVA